MISLKSAGHGRPCDSPRHQMPTSPWRPWFSSLRLLGASTSGSIAGPRRRPGAVVHQRCSPWCSLWGQPLLAAFQHFLLKHISFDSDPDEGHGAPSRASAVADRRES